MQESLCQCPDHPWNATEIQDSTKRTLHFNQKIFKTPSLAYYHLSVKYAYLILSIAIFGLPHLWTHSPSNHSNSFNVAKNSF